jgi:hypothetical protein
MPNDDIPNRPKEPAYRRPGGASGRVSVSGSGTGTHGGWDGILDPDEGILWQGRPQPGMSLRPGDYFMIAFGVFFAGFALIWMVLALQAGGFFWMFGVLHFSVGAGLVLWPLLGRPYVRSRTWYTLTNKRAFIASDVPIKGKSLNSYAITADTTLGLQDEQPGTIWFATERRRNQRGTQEHRIGFERIENMRDVYALFRKIPRAET